MTIDPESISSAARVASPEEGVSRDELQLAARNHGMPLEALRYPVTPAGLHYLLIHYDIPVVDPATFALTIEGRVSRPLTFSLDDLRARPAVELEVTMECAGNGRALLPDPRPVSQPWLAEAIGTGAWMGTPLAPILAEAGLDDDAVEVVGLVLQAAGQQPAPHDRHGLAVDVEPRDLRGVGAG